MNPRGHASQRNQIRVLHCTISNKLYSQNIQALVAKNIPTRNSTCNWVMTWLMLSNSNCIVIWLAIKAARQSLINKQQGNDSNNDHPTHKPLAVSSCSNPTYVKLTNWKTDSTAMEKVTFQISLKITSKKWFLLLNQIWPYPTITWPKWKTQAAKQDMEKGRRLLLHIDLFTISLAI